MAGRPMKRLKEFKEAGNTEEYEKLKERMIKAGREEDVDKVENPDKYAKKKIVNQGLVVINEQSGKTYDMSYEDSQVLGKIRESKETFKIKAQDPEVTDTELKTIYRVLKRLKNEELRLIFKYDFIAFDEYFFQDIQDRVATPPFHEEMFHLFQHSKRACVVCPRGHAKSTNARKYILHQILHNMIVYCIIVGSSEEMAGQNMRWVRDQLIDNKRIREVYGYLKDKNNWSDSSFNTNTGVKVTAKGWEQKLRGSNERGRPDLIYIDDIEDDEAVNSKDRREKLRQTMLKALLPMMSSKGRVILTGTILHIDSMLRNIMRNQIRDHIKWDVLFYQALNKDEEGNEYSLWPELWPIEILRTKREADPHTFAQEYQNDPRSGGVTAFEPSEYTHYEFDDIEVDRQHKSVIFIDRAQDGSYRRFKLNTMMTTDFAIGEKKRSDFTVFMITGMDSIGRLKVLEYVRMKTSDTQDMIDTMFTLLKKWYCDYATFEDRIIQKVLKRQLEREMELRDYYFHLHELARSDTVKMLRIKSLRAPIKTKSISWLEEHTELEDELNQVTVSSLGTHDDIIDCLADAWEVQIEIQDDRESVEPEINTLEWLIKTGQMPTVLEEEEELVD